MKNYCLHGKLLPNPLCIGLLCVLQQSSELRLSAVSEWSLQAFSAEYGMILSLHEMVEKPSGP